MKLTLYSYALLMVLLTPVLLLGLPLIYVPDRDEAGQSLRNHVLSRNGFPRPPGARVLPKF